MTDKLKTPALSKKPPRQEGGGTSLGRVLSELGSEARIEDDAPPRKSTKSKFTPPKPKATKSNVKDLTEGYAVEVAAIKDDPRYQAIAGPLEKKRKTLAEYEVRMEKKQALRNDEMFQEAVREVENEVKKLEEQLQPFQEQINTLEARNKQVERFLEDPSAPVDPEIKHAVEVRAEKSGAMSALKEQIDIKLAKAETDPAHVQLQKEVDKAKRAVTEVKNSGKMLRSEPDLQEQWEETLKEAENKAEELEFKLKQSQTRIDALREQSLALEEHLGSGETTGLPPELQSSIDQKAESAVLFRDVQDKIHKEIAAKDEELKKILQQEDIQAVYGPLERERETLTGMEKNAPRRGSEAWEVYEGEVEKTQNKIRELEQAMKQFDDRLAPAKQAKEELTALSSQINERLESMEFELDTSESLSAQLQERVDKAQAEAAGLEFQEKAKEVIIREAGARRTEAKVRATAEKQNTARATLDNLVKGDRDLKAGFDKAQEARAAVTEKTRKRDEAAELLKSKSSEYERLYAEIQAGDPAEQFTKLERMNALSEEINTAKQGMREANAALATAATEAEKAQMTLDNAITEKAKTDSTTPLAKAQQEFAAAKEAAAKAAAEQATAQQKLDEAKAAEKAAKGRENVLKMLPESKKAYAEAKDTLNQLASEGLSIGTGREDLQAEEIRKRLGDEKYKELMGKVKRMQDDYETLKANGATTEEIGSLYKETGIDEKWWPPQFRKEEQNWLALKDFITDENVKKRSEEESSKVDKFMSGLETGKGLTEKYATAVKGLTSKVGQKITNAAFGKELSEEQAESVGKFVALAGAICGMGKAITKTGVSGKELVEYKEKDPIEEMMLQDELIEAMGEMAKSGLELTGEALKILWKELPALGVISDAVDVMTSLKEAAERIANAMEDQRILEEAQMQENRGEKAFAQFANRDKHLAARASSDVAISALSAAAGVTTMTGVGAHVGAGMKAVSSGAKVAKMALETVIDKSAAQTAKNLLDKAQAGNAAARNEIFQHHPRYAKGLISLMAMEGDALALACLQNHGLSEDMIARSSAPIIKKYLMKRFKEVDEPSSWSDTWESIKGAAETVASGVTKVADFFTRIYDKINVAAREGSPKGLLSAIRLVDSPDMNEIAQSVGTYQSACFRRDGLASTSDESTKQKGDLTTLDAAIETARGKVQELRTRIAASNSALATLQGKVQTLLQGNRANEDLLESKKLTEQLLRKHLQAMDVVVKAL